MPALSYKLISQRFSPLLAALLTMLSISFTGSVSLNQPILLDLARELNGYSLAGVIASVTILLVYMRWWDDFRSYRSIATHTVAALFALFTVFGISYAANDTWDFVFASMGQFIIALFAFIGFFILFDFFVTLLFRLLDASAHANTSKEALGGNRCRLVDSHPFALAFCCIAIAWLPYLVLHLPGSVPYDGYRQINMGFGYEAISQHHPWLISLLFSTVMRIGQIISDNFGVFLVTSFLFVTEAACFASVCSSLRKLKAPIWAYALTIGFFAIVPAFGAYAQTVMKDGLYSALFALWFAEYIKLCATLRAGEDVTRQSVVFTTVIGLLVCLSRNNGLYIIVPAHILLAFCFERKARRQGIIANLTCLVVVYFALNNVVAPMIGVLPGPPKEMLTIPFQQTARYLRDYPEDVTDSEAEAIRAILDYEHLGERYNPERSDPVKDSFYSKSTTGDLLNYFQAWISMGLRHPDAYIQATLNNIFGYFYPGYNYTELGPYQFYIQGPPIATGDLDIHYIIPEGIRGLSDGWAQLWRNFPILNLVVNPATYTWLLVLCISFISRKNSRQSMIPIIPLVLNVAVCCISPVNGYLRYALPLIACTPTLLFWVASSCLERGGHRRAVNPPSEVIPNLR